MFAKLSLAGQAFPSTTWEREKSKWIFYSSFPSSSLGTRVQKVLLLHRLRRKPMEAKQELRGQGRSQAQLGNEE